jgi:hypothetical protein
LRQVAHAQARAAVHREARAVLAGEDHFAGVGADQADRHTEARGLARAVRTEEPDDLASADLEPHSVDDAAAAKGLHQPARLQKCRLGTGFGSCHARRV